jgi:hypothetical protein
MKPNVIPVTSASTNSPLTVLPTAKIVRHPRSKKLREEDLPLVRLDSRLDPPLDPPDEETLRRLNAIARQYPFCILHRGNRHNGLL